LISFIAVLENIHHQQNQGSCEKYIPIVDEVALNDNKRRLQRVRVLNRQHGGDAYEKKREVVNPGFKKQHGQHSQCVKDKIESGGLSVNKTGSKLNHQRSQKCEIPCH